MFQLLAAQEPPWEIRSSPERRTPDSANFEVQDAYCEMMRIQIYGVDPKREVEFPGGQPPEGHEIVLRHFVGLKTYTISMGMHKFVLEYSKWAGEGNAASMKAYEDMHESWNKFLEEDDEF